MARVVTNRTPFYSSVYGQTATGNFVNQRSVSGYYPTYLDNRMDEVVRGNHVDATTYFRSGGRMTSDSLRTTTEQFYLKDDQGHKQPLPFWDLVSSNSIYPNAALWEIPGEFTYLDNDNGAAVTKALNELSPDGASFGAAIGESPQVVDMFLDAAGSMVSAINSAKRGNWALAAKHLGMNPKDIANLSSPANGWLQWSYGWKPFMADLADLQEQVHKTIDSTDVVAKGSSSTTLSRSWEKDGMTFNMSSKSSVLYVLKAKIVRRQLYRLSNMGLVNPASVAWELVPFSFVIDWFMPVGNTLSALTASAGMEFQGGYKNEKLEHTITAKGPSGSSVSDVGSGVLVRGTQSPGLCSYRGYKFSRWKLENFPLPDTYANTSPFMNKDGTAKAGRIANAVALIR